MKIRVTWIVLLCTSFAAITESTIESKVRKAQWLPSNNRVPERRDVIKRAVQRYKVYEYSRSMNAADVNFANNTSQGRVNQTVYHPENVNAQVLSNDVGKRHDNESEKFSPQQNTLRTNSKQVYKISDAEISPRSEKVTPRKRKYKMEQAVLALLMAYKMKFTALIPILLGGLSLLISATSLAGFFFALFAAVLGLKTH